MKTLLTICACIFVCNMYGQEQDAASTIKNSYYIRPGQKIYTQSTKGILKGLEPFHREIHKTVNGVTQILIEDGDFERIDSLLSGKNVTTRGDYNVYTTTVINGDSSFASNKKEVSKTASIKLEISFVQKDDKMLVRLARGIKPNTADHPRIDPHSGSADTINSLDNKAEFYWKLLPGETFTYHQDAIVIGAISLPFKVRFKTDESPSTVETELSNIGFYVGKRWGAFSYRDNSFHARKLTLAPFVGPAKINLKKDNTKGIVTDDINRLGITTGLSFLLSAGNFGLGIAGGVDMLTDKYRKDWVYNKKMWLGFAIGYKISFL